MKGAKNAKLFKTGQYGKLYVISSCHARGRTLKIQVLPDGEKAISNGANNECLNSDAVLVYGIVCGTCGWTEEYGWIHEGKWQDDFHTLVEQKKQELREQKKIYEGKKQEELKTQEARERKLLNNY